MKQHLIHVVWPSDAGFSAIHEQAVAGLVNRILARFIDADRLSNYYLSPSIYGGELKQRSSR